MPTRPINHHDYIFVPIARRDLVRKQLHAMPVNLRQNQRIKPPIYRADRAIGVGCLHLWLTIGLFGFLSQQWWTSLIRPKRASS
jgi:hypothetical protein